MAGHAGVAGRRCRGVGDICIPGGGGQADTGKHHAPYLADRPGDIQHQYGDQRPDRTAGRSDNLFRGVEKTVSPYLIIIQVIPILGMAPIVLAITGDIGVSRIIIAAILTFYPVAANTLSGFRATEREKKELMYSYAANKFQLYTKTYIPNCIPYFFTGLKISAPMAITASILVDTLQGDGGLGCMLSQAQKHAMSIYVFWLIVLFSACVGILSFTIMGWLENMACPYRRTGTHRRGGKRHGRKK